MYFHKEESTIKNTVKVSFSKCQVPNRRELFKQSSCIMPISVGQGLQVHEGKKFSATMDLVNSSFKRCTLLMDDTIQRHTMKIFNKESDDKLTNLALKEGDVWLERNKPFYERLSIEYNIMRWNDWITHSLYLSKFMQINNLYQDNINFKAAIDDTINEYILRLSKRNPPEFSQLMAIRCCLEYLLEECTVMCLWAHEGYDFELYPTGRNFAMKAAYEHIVKKDYQGKLVSVSLHFRNMSRKVPNGSIL